MSELSDWPACFEWLAWFDWFFGWIYWSIGREWPIAWLATFRLVTRSAYRKACFDGWLADCLLMLACLLVCLIHFRLDELLDHIDLLVNWLANLSAWIGRLSAWLLDSIGWPDVLAKWVLELAELVCRIRPTGFTTSGRLPGLFLRLGLWWIFGLLWQVGRGYRNDMIASWDAGLGKNSRFDKWFCFCKPS